MKTDETHESVVEQSMARRSFLRYAGIGAASAGLLVTASCKKDGIGSSDPAKGNSLNGLNAAASGMVDIGSGDYGILNYAYALEQLEAAFYTQVIKTPYAGMSSAENKYLTRIRDHEVLHREFFKAALGSHAIIALTPDFSAIDFNSRASVLGAAKAFEDLGVSAYDGAGYLIQNPAYLTLAGKIVSVEARHAALIRDLISPGTFVGPDVVETHGLNHSKAIKEVLPIANMFLKTKVSASNYGYIG